MSHERRSYGQYCGLAGALDVIGERWTLLILRELLIGPCRYGQLLADLPGIGTNLLADRLKYLAGEGLVEVLPDRPGKVRHYRVTEAGEALRPAVLSLARWGLTRLSTPALEDAVRPRWAMLAVEAMTDESQAAGLDESYEFGIDDETFHVAAHDGKVSVAAGPADRPTLIARTDARTFIDIGARRITPLEAALSRRLSMEGSMDAVMRCCRLLGLEPGGSGSPEVAEGDR